MYMYIQVNTCRQGPQSSERVFQPVNMPLLVFNPNSDYRQVSLYYLVLVLNQHTMVQIILSPIMQIITYECQMF